MIFSSEKSLSDELLDMLSLPTTVESSQLNNSTSTSNHNAMNNDSIVKLYQSNSTPSLKPPPQKDDISTKLPSTSSSDQHLSSLFQSKTGFIV